MKHEQMQKNYMLFVGTMAAPKISALDVRPNISNMPKPMLEWNIGLHADFSFNFFF